MYKIGLSTFSEAATQHIFKERKKEFFKLTLRTKMLFKSLYIGRSKYVARKISNPEITSPDVNCYEFN